MEGSTASGEHEARIRDLERHRVVAEDHIKELFDHARILTEKVGRLDEQTKSADSLIKEIKEMLKEFSKDTKTDIAEFAKSNVDQIINLKKDIDKIKATPGEYWKLLMAALISAGGGIMITKLLNL